MNKGATFFFRASIILMILLSSGCAVRGRRQSEMGILSSAVTKLTSNVEGTVRWPDTPLPSNISEADLIAKSTEHNPEILKFFQNYSIKILHNDRDAIILVCTKDRKQALFEDAGCTTQLDKILWKDKPAKKCEFTTTVQLACPKK